MTQRVEDSRSPRLSPLELKVMAWLERGRGISVRGNGVGCVCVCVRSHSRSPPFPSPSTHLLPHFSACCHQDGILVADKGVGGGEGETEKHGHTQR